MRQSLICIDETRYRDGRGLDSIKNWKECGGFVWVRLKTSSKLREGWIAENTSQVDDRITIAYDSGCNASGFAWRKLSEERNRIIDGNKTTSNSEKREVCKRPE
jgi:hypothetical protein